jgi:hypothetical protein
MAEDEAPGKVRALIALASVCGSAHAGGMTRKRGRRSGRPDLEKMQAEIRRIVEEQRANPDYSFGDTLREYRGCHARKASESPSPGGPFAEWARA